MKKICPITESIKIIGTKPRLLIIRYLNDNGKSFNDLRKNCSISSRTLSINLKYLLDQNIVGYKKENNKNIYFLTKKGAELIPIINTLGNWGLKWKVC